MHFPRTVAVHDARSRYRRSGIILLYSGWNMKLAFTTLHVARQIKAEDMVLKAFHFHVCN
jgi:hypothetical protein